MLDPLADELASNIYLAAHGPLLGVPVDLLHAGGEPLAQNYRLAHIELASLKPGSDGRFRMPAPSSVFLAGDPQNWTGEFASRIEISDEVRAVGDFFIGPGLNAVQGISLLTDELLDGRYAQADLVHLSVPGVIDLSGRQPSSLFLSEPARGEGPERLTASTLESISIQANLVFLSGTEFTGSSKALENRKGVISSLLDAGANTVIATLWPVSPESRTRFVRDFYNRLGEDEDIMSAMTGAKRDSMRAGENTDWAGFQLFLD